MAIAFVNGEVQRVFVKTDGKTPFFATTLKETYTDKDGEERLGGYHNVVAFGEEALEMGTAEEGDHVDVQCRVSYREDDRFEDDNEKHPYMVSFVVQKVNRITPANNNVDDEDDPFA